MTTDAPAPVSGRRRAQDGGGRRRARSAPQSAPSGGHGGRRRRKPKSRIGRFFKWTAITLAVVLVLGGGAAFFYYKHLNDQLAKNAGDLTLGTKMKKSKANAAGQTPLNILLLGSDSRDGAANVKLGGAADTAGAERADVEMLLHVSADRSNVSVLSIPRDTTVDIPSCHDTKNNKTYPAVRTTINASLTFGGPGCTVATWYALTGIPIDHYMKVDFSGVVDMADAIGGVPVCVNANVQDPKSHLKLTKGTHKIAGVQALEWLRTRHGFEDGSDIGRTHAQHMYMNSLARQMQSSSTMGSPSKMMSLAETAVNKVSVDKELANVKKLYNLGMTLKGVNLKRMVMLTMPWGPDPANPKAHVVPSADAKPLFEMIRNDIALDKHGKPATAADKKKAAAATGDAGSPSADSSASSGAKSSAPAVDKAAVAVTVKNGSLTPRRAAQLTEALQGKGFSKAVNGSNTVNPSTDSSTGISYPKGDSTAKKNALAVADALNIPSGDVKESATESGVVLVIGGDWTSGTDYASVLPKAGSVPKSASAESADDTAACMTVNVRGGYTF